MSVLLAGRGHSRLLCRSMYTTSLCVYFWIDAISFSPFPWQQTAAINKVWQNFRWRLILPTVLLHLTLPNGAAPPLDTLLRAHQRWTRQGQAPTPMTHHAGASCVIGYPGARLRTDHPPSSLPPQTAEHTSLPGCCGVRSDRRCVLSTCAGVLCAPRPQQQGGLPPCIPLSLIHI